MLASRGSGDSHWNSSRSIGTTCSVWADLREGHAIDGGKLDLQQDLARFGRRRRLQQVDHGFGAGLRHAGQPFGIRRWLAPSLINRRITETDLLRPLDLPLKWAADIRAGSGAGTRKETFTGAPIDMGRSPAACFTRPAGTAERQTAEFGGPPFPLKSL
jgi:hypothetical protein